MYILIDNKIYIENIEYQKTKEFTYRNEDYIEILSKKTWKKKILHKDSELKYSEIEDKKLFKEILKENYVQALDIIF